MGLFNRGPKTPDIAPTGPQVNQKEIMDQVGRGTRPGTETCEPDQFWVMLIVVDTHQVPPVSYLEHEEPMYIGQVRAILHLMEQHHGQQPKRINKVNLSDVDGVWMAHGRGRRFADLLAVVPHGNIGIVTEVERMRRANGLPDRRW